MNTADPALSPSLPASISLAVLDSMTEGVSVSTEAGVIVYTNPAEDAMFGYESGELVGKHVTVQNAYDTEENARRVSEVIDELRRSGSWTGEWLNRRKNGTPFRTHARITSITADGQRYFVCVQDDITEREKAQARFSRIVESIADGFVAVDRLGSICYANGEAGRLLGTTADALLLQSLSLHFQDLLLEQKLASGGPVHAEIWLARSSRWLEVTAYPDHDGGASVLLRDITSRKLAEEERERERQHITDILEAVSESFIAVDRNWRVTYANARVLERLGLPRDLVIGSDLWTVAPEAPSSDLRPQYERVMRDRVPVRFEMFYPSNGRWYDVNVHPTDEGLAAHVLDITGRRRAEESLRHLALSSELARKQLQVTLDSLVQPLLVIDREGRIIEANQAAAELHQFHSREELLATVERFGELFEARDAQGRVLDVSEWPAARALLGETVRAKELHVTRRETGATWVGSYDASPIRDESDRVVRIVVVIYDLTARKEAEAALAESEQQFRLLTHALPQLVWTSNPDGTTDFFSDQWKAYTGRAGEDWPAAFHPDDIPEAVSAWRNALAAGEPLEVRSRIRRHDDGAYRWHLIRGFPLKGADGRILKWVGANTDIEEEVQAQSRLQDAAERLTLALEASRMGDR